jgi:hypothetical protein
VLEVPEDLPGQEERVMKRAILTLDLPEDPAKWLDTIHDAAWRATEVLNTAHYGEPQQYTITRKDWLGRAESTVRLEIVEVEP